MTRLNAVPKLKPAPLFSANGKPEPVTIKPDQMYAVVETITALQAQRILDEANEGTETLRQRRLSAHVVASFVGVIERGEWLPVPPGIVYDTDLRLLNGQHRLAAQVRMEATLPWWVTYNCPAEVFSVIDTGKKRTVGDALFMTGATEKSSAGPHLASALRLMYNYEQSLRTDGAVEPEGWAYWYQSPISPIQALQVFERHPKLVESLTVGFRLHSASIRYNGAAVTVWHRLVSDAHPKAAEQVAEFAEQVAHGRMLDDGDPTYALRSWWTRGAPASGNADHHRCARERALFGLIVAWNAFARRQPLRSISVSGRKPMPTVEDVRPAPRREGAGRA